MLSTKMNPSGFQSNINSCLNSLCNFQFLLPPVLSENIVKILQTDLSVSCAIPSIEYLLQFFSIHRLSKFFGHPLELLKVDTRPIRTDEAEHLLNLLSSTVTTDLYSHYSHKVLKTDAVTAF